MPQEILSHGHPQDIDQVRVQLGELLQNTLDQLATLDGDLGSYGRSLLDLTAGQLHELDITEVGEIFSSIIAETLQVMQAEKQLTRDLHQAKDAASKDALTGLFNRGTFDMALASDVDLSREESTALSLIMLDIDHFKRVNDTYGHQVGDNVIRSVASTILECIKGRDFAARYGGEEFTIILSSTSEKGAMAVAEHIRRAVDEKCLGEHLCDAPDHPVTISLGVATLHEIEQPGQLLERADTALYQSKRNGRNRVSSAEDTNDS